jgi:leucyl aminopeptidase
MYQSIQAGGGAAGVHVVGVHTGTRTLAGEPRLARGPRESLRRALDTPGFKADAGETALAEGGHLLLGLGKKADLTADQLRLIASRLMRRLDRMGPRAIRLHVPPAPDDGVPPVAAAAAFAEGMALANWRVDFFAGSATQNPAAHRRLTVNLPEAAVRRGFQRGLTLGECTNYARRLAATPPNVCTPRWIAAESRRMARQAGLRCRVIDYAAARRMGMGGLVSVGQGSATKPCLIILEHRPARIAASARGTRLALVGKTITFDTGGYSLKVNNGMKGMKYDKCGGMAVLGAMRAVAALRLPVHVFGVLPAAENMVAGDAYRPDDIITMLNGVTVEVTNTDAEGRLVLADALAYTCRTLKATAVVDMATLTGGVVVALGSWCAGLWCDDAGLRKRLDAAAASSGERLWPLPLWKEHRDFMRAKHADLWNSAPKRDGHPIQGAAFLSYFVTEGVPWAHIDIAGTSNVESDKDLHVIGPTGYGVRLLAELAGGYAAPA